MRALIVILVVVMLSALVAHFLFDNGLVAFIASAIALIILSKIMGDATEQLSRYMGETPAGLINVTSSNLGEIIILTVAILKGMIEVALAGLVGSMIGNILFVLGSSIYFGCRKNGDLPFNKRTGKLYINMFFVVASILILPTLFEKDIPVERMQIATYFQAIVLFGVYIYFYRLSLKDPRFKSIQEHVDAGRNRWSKNVSIAILIACALGSVCMSEILVGEIGFVALTLGISKMFIGYVLFPLLGNIAEHFVAIVAAMKKKVELSLAIAVGSATQVGMVVAPIAVFIGFITGHPVILNFTGMPWTLLALTFIGGSIAINDDQLTKEKGVMLLALYFISMVFFALAN